MPKIAKALTAMEISRLTQTGKYAVGTVSGLYLIVGETLNARHWVLRVRTATGRREFGLGAYPAIRLAQAHQRALEIKDKLQHGIDPVIEKQKATQSLLDQQQAEEQLLNRLTFKTIALQYLNTKSHEWKSIKHYEQWKFTLDAYAFPILGELYPEDITTVHILKVLNPMWHIKTETASRLRGRIERVLDYAKSMGQFTGNNPAMWKGGLNMLLATPHKFTKVVHHKALPYTQLPPLIALLYRQLNHNKNNNDNNDNNNELNTLTPQKTNQINQYRSLLCLVFIILTAVRSGEARGAYWHEIDFKTAIWTIPEERMKAGKAHQVPLSRQAIEVLQLLLTFNIELNSNNNANNNINPPLNTLIFSTKKSTLMSDTLVLNALKQLGYGHYTVHGFRSTFRDWAAECTQFDRLTCEHALAHQLPNKVEAAYLRSQFLDKRRDLMQQWAEWCFND